MKHNKNSTELENRSAELSSPSSKANDQTRNYSDESLDYKTFVEARDTLTLVLNNLVALQKTIVLAAGKVLSINWLDDWRPFSFEGLKGSDIAAKQDHIERLALGYLMRYNLSNGTNYRPEQISWRRIITNPGNPEDLYNPLVMALEIYTNPRAQRSPGGPGGGGSSVTPTPPPQPPPPAIG